MTNICSLQQINIMRLRVQIEGPQTKQEVFDKKMQEALQFHGQAIYNKIVAKVPELQKEEANLVIIFDGNNYKPDFSFLSKDLKNKIKDAGF